MTQKASMVVDYQQRAKAFVVGDVVSSTGSTVHDLRGRVVAVYPAIGMVDVEWPGGNSREPVEGLQRYVDGNPAPPEDSNVPGGTGKSASLHRVAEAFVKKGLYWGAADRHYKATKAECDSGRYNCPRCKAAVLQTASYQRANGASEKLLGCPKCLFLIKQCDIIGHPSYVDDSTVSKKADDTFTRTRLTGGN